MILLNFDPLIPAPSAALRTGFSRREKEQEFSQALNGTPH
jgi:hypothetical protein